MNDTSQQPPHASGRSSKRGTASLPRRLGNFELFSVIAEGGMGRVYHGRHVLLDRVVAVKVLKEGLPHKAEIMDRLRQEAQALARINHPNVVHVIDLGEAEGQSYIAMDFAPGMDLARWLKRDGTLDANNLLYVARQLMAGIAAAHTAGILHRDIKPDNVIVDHHGSVKITDFGLADDERLVRAGKDRQRYATPAYAAPEVLMGKPADARSDVYSIAATIYQLACGLLPFGNVSSAAILAEQRKGTVDLGERVADLPDAWVAVIMRSLSFEAGERPSDAGAMLALAFPEQRRASFVWWWVALAAGLVGATMMAWTWLR